MTLRGVPPRLARRHLRVVFLLLALGAAACGDKTSQMAGTTAAMTAAPVATGSRLTIEEQLVLRDAREPLVAYIEVLTILTQKCRESRSELAAAVIEGQRALTAERGITVALLDYLRGVDSVVPAGSRDVNCTTVVAELGRTIGR